MAYEVTATRKRPASFEKLVGQEFVVSTIENAIESGRIAHAYLFSGPRGVGKTSSARLLAKALNCEKGPTAHPCGVCSNCREITEGNSVDVIEIDGASNTSVNDIRVIKDEVLFPPQSSRYKIYIIDEVHMLSNSAFNALLKTIEEPPEYIIFIFATTELQKVPATIRSRCQQFRFQLIGLEEIKGCLREAADEMGITADDDALFWIAREATGSMRDAYTLFDQVASFSGNHITLEGIRSKLGIAGTDAIEGIVRAAVAGDGNKALTELSALISAGISVDQIVRDFTSFFRSLLLAKDGVVNEEILSMQRESMPEDLLSALSRDQLEAALRTLLQLYREIRYSISARYEIELFVSRLTSLGNLVSPEELVSRLESFRKDITEGKVSVVKEAVPVKIITEEKRSAPEAAQLQKEQAPPLKAEDEKKPSQPAEVVPESGQAAPHYEAAPEEYQDEDEEDDEEEEHVPPAIDEKPRTPSTPEALVPPPARELSSYLREFQEALKECSDWRVSGMSQNLLGIVETENDGVELRCATQMFASALNESPQVRELFRSLTGYGGRLNAVLVEEKKQKADEKLSEIARIFRGSVIFEEEKKEKQNEQPV